MPTILLKKGGFTVFGGRSHAGPMHGETLASHSQACGKGKNEVWLPIGHVPETSVDLLRIKVRTVLSNAKPATSVPSRLTQVSQSCL